ncbi:MAG TPA: SAM-dependent methyltransferase [Pseudonocardiaceae bacterium]|nr:SAM-dependent methyltransferase [Pseudonocardiaceae bacterium]
MADTEWAPPGVDISKPSIARTYDAFLGGTNNVAVDRAVLEQSLRVMPDIQKHAKTNRAFLRRVVHYLAAEAGIRQFLDIGSGLPTQQNVHEVAQDVDPQARVIYVDNDPLVPVHAQALLGDTETVKFVTADIRSPEEIIKDPTVRKLLDFDRPIGLLLFAILHHLNDHENPASIAARLRDALPSGSYLAISHAHNPGSENPEVALEFDEIERIFNENLGTGRFRTRSEILGYFGDFKLIEPGLVWVPDWRPDPEDSIEQRARFEIFAGGVARRD